VDLPVEDDSKGLACYAAVVADTIGSHPRQTIVTHSMAAFIAPMIACLVEVEMLVLVAPMVPRPGETALEWLDNTGQRAAARRMAAEQGHPTGFSVPRTYLHDLPEDVAREFQRHTRKQAMRPFREPWPLACWPRTPATSVIVGRRDRLFPYEFQCGVVAERLGSRPRAIEGGHLCALSAPAELTEQLVGTRG
jgi:pimeloyl-ACP methyl ester carboxylesterase